MPLPFFTGSIYDGNCMPGTNRSDVMEVTQVTNGGHNNTQGG